MNEPRHHGWHHQRHWHHRHHGGRRVLGLMVIVWGVVMLMRALHIPGLEDLHRWFWPAAMVGTGAAALAFGRGGERAVGGILLAIGVPMVINRFFGWHLEIWTLIWPAMLIFFGFKMLVRPRHDMRQFHVNIQTAVNDGLKAGGLREDRDDTSTAGASTSWSAAPGDASGATSGDPAGMIREFAFLGGIERNNVSQAFRGGEITAALGGVQLDLRECRMAPEGARLEILAFMGGVSLRIPKDWCVVSDVSVMLGGMDNRTSAPVDGAAPKLHISGQAIMGGIEIKN